MTSEQNFMSSSQFAVPMLPNNYANSNMTRIATPLQEGGGESGMINSGSMPSTSTVSYSLPNRNNSTSMTAAGVIRRRRFSTAKIQPTRIKKVMQSDEEIGRMVQSVPVSIGRAMEHFAEKFLQAAADATQYTNSKTLTPQHMKQAMLANPHFQFLEPILKDIVAPQLTVDISMSRIAMTLKEQQQLKEQHNSELASAILANAQMNIKQLEQQSNNQIPEIVPMQLLSNRNSVDEQKFDLSNDNGQQFPISPITPTTQLAGVMEMLHCASQQISAQAQSQNKLNGTKRPSTDGSLDSEEKPKRGRPKKKKSERLVEDVLFEEASQNVEMEEKDRQMMPPPSLPIGLPRQ